MTSRNAKELCAMLITRSLKDLNDEEEEIVVDYLEKLKIKTKLSMEPRELCTLLLEKSMEKDLGKKVPITAYANSVLNKEQQVKEEKAKVVKSENIKSNRSLSQKNLEEMESKLPGCLPGDNVFGRQLYNLIIDPNVGIMNLPDGTSHYSAVISVSERLYNDIFLNNTTPIIELRTNKGFKAFAKIAFPHSGNDMDVYVSPLIAQILNLSGMRNAAFLQLCNSLPDISHVKFTFYGSQAELDKVLQTLITKLPFTINAFSYLSLGMVLIVNLNGQEVQVRVDSLSDDTERPIFAGLIPFAETDLPFDISPDL